MNTNISFQEAQKCFEAVRPDPGPNFKWRVPFKIHSRVHHFEARLGPPGGDKGYKAITGQDPPFIELCWWINNKLLPELTVYRGETYYFKVNIQYLAPAKQIIFTNYIQKGGWPIKLARTT